MNYTFLILIVGLALTLAGCGSQKSLGNSSHEQGLSYEGAKVEIDSETLESQGYKPIEEVDNSAFQIGRRQNRTRLRQGTKLIAVIDTECAARNRHGLSKDIQDSSGDSHFLRRQAYAFQLNADMDLDDLNNDAGADNCVLQVSNDLEVHTTVAPSDPYYSRQWHLNSIEASAGYDYFYGAAGISSQAIIAVIDTGVDYNHPDLQANMWRNSSGAYGYDFANRDSDPIDDHGHGTHVAGIAAAVRNNSVGVSGVAGTSIKIMAIKVLNSSGSGSTSNIINGINYAIENGANVINLSLGGKGSSSSMRTALANAASKGVVVLVSAGNNGELLTSSNIFSPASYAKDIEGVLAVGSLDSSGSKSSFSNYSSSYVEISAPGSSIYSTVRNNRYGTMSGTSMSAPVASGAAALTVAMLKSKGLAVTASAVEKLLRDGSLKSSSLASSVKDGSRINLRILGQAINGGVSAPAPSPSPSPSPAPSPAPSPSPAPTPAPLPAPNPSACGSLSADACTVFKGINAERTSRGLAALTLLSNCQNLAQSHAEDMADNNFFSHTSPTEGSFSQRVSRFGVSGGSAGENIAYGYTLSGVVSAWMNSSGHRANILNSSYRSTGLGFVRNSSGRPYYVQCFSSKAGNL